MSPALSFGIGTAALSVIVLGFTMAMAAVFSPFAPAPKVRRPKTAEPATSFTCRGCWTGPWDIA